MKFLSVHRTISGEASGKPDWQPLLQIIAALIIYVLMICASSNSEVRYQPLPNIIEIIGSTGKSSKCGSEPRRAIFELAPIDVNKADAEIFASLKGIGPELASRIVIYRDDCNGFKNVSEIMNVKGIGRKKFNMIAGELKICPK